MSVPEVSRFIRDVLIAGGHALSQAPDDREAYTHALEAWQETRARVLAAARGVGSVAELPAWVLDLAAQLGVQR